MRGWCGGGAAGRSGRAEAAELLSGSSSDAAFPSCFQVTDPKFGNTAPPTTNASWPARMQCSGLEEPRNSPWPHEITAHYSAAPSGLGLQLLTANVTRVGRVGRVGRDSCQNVKKMIRLALGPNYKFATDGILPLSQERAILTFGGRGK